MKQYQKMYYAERLKSDFDARWAVKEKERAVEIANGNEVEDERAAMLKVSTALLKEKWAAEDAKTKQLVKKAVQTRYKAQLKKKKNIEKGPQTPEEYHE